MKLLSPPAGKSRQQIENAANELRAQQLDEVLRGKRKEINDIEKLFNSTLSEQEIRQKEEERVWRETLSNLKAEVENLERRKALAQVPLEEKERRLDNDRSALSKREEAIVIKESDLEYTKEKLEDKLDAVSEREQEAEKYAQTLNNREFAIQLQEAQIRERMKSLTVVLQETYEEIVAAQAEAAQRKAILKGRDVSITEREKYVDMQLNSFADRERAINDRYKTLLRAITETNLKQNVK